MERNLGKILCQRRVELGLSQRELADRLSAYGIVVSNQAISKWETGSTQPNAQQFLALCRTLDIQDVLGTFTDAHSALNQEGRRLVDAYIRVLVASGLYSARRTPAPVVRTLPLYAVSASAGTGQFLDSSDYETVEVGDEVPLSANFGVRLAGDSMEPRFHDGQIVWVRQQPVLGSGEFGIFLLRGEAYCKKLLQRDGKTLLCSLNPAYPPLEIRPEDDFRVLGKVL